MALLLLVDGISRVDVARTAPFVEKQDSRRAPGNARIRPIAERCAVGTRLRILRDAACEAKVFDEFAPGR
jgi:hypothetical protein